MAEEKKHGGGPKTTEGKARSRQNSTRHGLRATSAWLLPDETQEEFDAVEAGWNQQFQPSDFQQQTLVKSLVLNDWLRRRAERWLLTTEAAVIAASGPNPLDWTAEQRQRMELGQRYKGTADRAFHRTLSLLQKLCEERKQAEPAPEIDCTPPEAIIVIEDSQAGDYTDVNNPDAKCKVYTESFLKLVDSIQAAPRSRVLFTVTPNKYPKESFDLGKERQT
jgi:hypothetical protein